MTTLKSFKYINKLVYIGGDSLRIRENGMIEGAVTVQQNKSTLTLTGTSSTSFSLSFGSNRREFSMGELQFLAPLFDSHAATQICEKYLLEPSCCISSLVLCGNGVIEPLPWNFTEKRLKCRLLGSGDITLPSKSFSHLALVSSGSGDIVGDTHTRTEYLSVSLAGSGDIYGIDVETAGRVEHMGSGDVSIRAKKESSILCKQYGSGQIKIHQ